MKQQYSPHRVFQTAKFEPQQRLTPLQMRRLSCHSQRAHFSMPIYLFIIIILVTFQS